MEIYNKCKKDHETANKIWEREKKKSSIMSHQEQEWSIGNPNNHEIQAVSTNCSWKRNSKKNEGQAAIAWVLQSGSTITKHNSRILANSPLQTEAMAVLQAAKDFQWRCANLHIKTDCQEIINSFNNSMACNKDIASIIKEIKDIADSFQLFRCSKATREEVQIAHELANETRKI